MVSRLSCAINSARPVPTCQIYRRHYRKVRVSASRDRMIAQKLLATQAFAESLPKARKSGGMSDTALAAFFSEDNMQDVAPRRPDEESVGTNENRVDQPDLRPSDLPDPDTLPELRIYSRSTMFFWWPVLVTGYILAAITY